MSSLKIREPAIDEAPPIDMNLALVDPFVLAQDYPDALTNHLRI